MSGIVFEDPAPRRRGLGRTDWPAVVDELKRRAGDWAIVKKNLKAGSVGSTSHTIRAYGCETTSRKQDDGSYNLYARWPEDVS